MVSFKNASKDAEQADAGFSDRDLAALAAIHPVPLDDETIGARFMPPVKGSGRPVIRRFYRRHDQLLAAAQEYRATHHLYFGIGLRRGQNGTADNVSRLGACWADIDGKLWADEPDCKAAALLAIERLERRPSIVVDSGGGYQAYWLLDAPVDLRVDGARARIETTNAALARAVCGSGRRPDHVQDIARVFRLPGSLNHKPEYGHPRPVQVVSFEPDSQYRLDDLERVLSDRYPWALRALPPTVQPDVVWTAWTGDLDQLRARAANSRIRRSTLALLESTGDAGLQSASEADAVIACALIGAGLTEAEAFALLLNSTRGQDAFERKGPRYGEAYLSRTVRNAAAYMGRVEERQAGVRVRYAGVSGTGVRTIRAGEVAVWRR